MHAASSIGYFSPPWPSRHSSRFFYAEENWRGARVWAAAKRDLQAQGETLDFRDFIPPPVPDDRNLAMAPLFVRAFQYKFDPKTQLLTFDHTATWTNSDTYKELYKMPWGSQRAAPPIPEASGYVNWATGHVMELPRWQAYYRQRKDFFPLTPQPQTPAEDVLLALTRFKPLLDELAQAASERPETRFPYNWTQQPPWSINLPAYNTLQVIATTLRLRAVAELRTGQVNSALGDLLLVFRLRQGTERDPGLIGPLVDMTCTGISMQAIWEGLAARQWSSQDLEALHNGLHRIDFLRRFQQAMRSERAFFMVQLPEQLQDQGQAWEFAKSLQGMTDGSSLSSNSPYAWLWRALPFWPRGWYARNAAVGSRYLQEYGVDAVDAANQRISLAKFRKLDPAPAKIPLTSVTMLARISLSAYSGLAYRFVQAQVVVNQALIACALERYFLDHHMYPAALVALVPDYLVKIPNDVIDGAPMRYRLTVDGRYQLWSIGRDGRDDGGAVDWPPVRNWHAGAPPEPGHRFPSPVKESGDWVWQYSPAEPPDPPANRSRLESLAPP